jgi:hypothetical protein
MTMSKIGLTTADFIKLNGQSMWRTMPNDTPDENEPMEINPNDPNNAITDMEEDLNNDN